MLDDLTGRGLRRPDFLIVDGKTGLDGALAASWTDVPAQRCTIREHRNLPAHAPEKPRDEVTADHEDTICAETAAGIMARRKAFPRKWRLRHRPLAESLEEAGDRLSTFTHQPSSQRKSARTSNGHPAPARGVQAAHRDPDGPALVRHRRDAVLGLFRPPAGSWCARSTAGPRSPSRSPTSPLRSQPDAPPSCRPDPRHRMPACLATVPREQPRATLIGTSSACRAARQQKLADRANTRRLLTPALTARCIGFDKRHW